MGGSVGGCPSLAGTWALGLACWGAGAPESESDIQPVMNFGNLRGVDEWQWDVRSLSSHVLMTRIRIEVGHT